MMRDIHISDDVYISQNSVSAAEASIIKISSHEHLSDNPKDHPNQHKNNHKQFERSPSLNES